MAETVYQHIAVKNPIKLSWLIEAIIFDNFRQLISLIRLLSPPDFQAKHIEQNESLLPNGRLASCLFGRFDTLAQPWKIEQTIEMNIPQSL